MRRILCAALCLLGLLTACGVRETPAASGSPAPDAPRIVATIFPVYDWARQIAPGADIALLLQNGADMHSYQPTVDDIITISDADLFIYVGGESDRWVTEALRGSRTRTLNLMETLGGALREEEALPGMSPEAEEETAYDEHIWLSLRNASACCAAIADALTEIGVAADADAYRVSLADLDARYAQAVADAPCKSVLFADRFPFRYLTQDYGLDAYAAFQGCSAETEASFETVAFLSATLDELELPAVLTTESADGKLAETIVRTSQRPDTPILSMDSMQSVTAAEIASGADYLSIMEKNLEILRRALGA